MNRTPCPDKQALERLALGQALPEELEPLAEHLEQCPRCTETLVGLKPEDTLTSAVRAQKAAAVPPQDEAVEALIGQLAAVPPPAGQSEATVVQGSPPAGGAAYPFLAPPEEPGEIGRLGSYRVLKALGAGGMGVVFQAQDLHLRRPVALKVMKPALAANEGDRQRFLREARAAAAVAHDHIITIFQVGEDRGTPFLTMQFLEGETLEDRLKREGRLPLAEVLRLGRELAEGLAVAHEHGLIHRDIKPANVWLEAPRGRVKVLDFGLARPRGDEAHLTQSGAIVGTPAYMAPEQARGEEVDARADLFSLGCVLYRMATGELPFKGKDALSQLNALATQQPKPPRALNPAIPRALDALILRLLSKDLPGRPASAAVVVRELAALERAMPAAPDTAAPPSRRRRGPVIAAAVVLLGLLGAATWLYGPTVVRIATNKGELVIRVADPTIEVVVKQPNTATVVDRTRDRTFILTAADGEVEFYEPDSGVRLLTKEFKLERGGRTVVDAREELAKAQTKPTAEAVAGPTQVAEPPPLAEWLKGRTVLTVSQDGKGQFRTIQAALDALEPHQVVKILDRGPYHEWLRAGAMPSDTGLISERQTVLELPRWELNEGKDIGWAHMFGPLDGFRLSGLRMVAPSRKDWGGILKVTQPSGLVIEDCCIGSTELRGPESARCYALSLVYPEGESGCRRAFVHNCVFQDSAGVSLGWAEFPKVGAVVMEHNYLKNTNFIVGTRGADQVLIRHNVIDCPTGDPIWISELMDVDGMLEISNNTAAPRYGIGLVEAAPKRGLTVRNNITGMGLDLDGQAGKVLPEAVKTWQVDHNCYTRRGAYPPAPTDLVADPGFLSLDPADRNYLRLPAESPLAKGGAGGAWPSYVGALPPGPAPKEGDWFTRLRERWPIAEAPAGTPPASAAPHPVAAPVQVAEPPPLAEWLKGRTVLTVSQDGRGQFKTIQAALDALEPHQVVKILDRGPYRESLRAGALPADTGLVSEQQTVLELPGWLNAKGDDIGKTYLFFAPLDGFRLSGLRVVVPPRKDWGAIIEVWHPSGLVIEDCCIGSLESGKGARCVPLALGWPAAKPDCKTAFVRNCLFFDSAGISLSDENDPGVAAAVLEQNYFKNTMIGIDTGHVRQVLIRHNVIDNPDWHGIWIDGLQAVGGILEISNNTVVPNRASGGFVFQKAAPKQGVIVRNNITRYGLSLDGEVGKVLPEVVKTWHVDHNGYTLPGAYPSAPTDSVAKPDMLSLDPANPNYLRLPAESPLAKGGAGGAWPSYVGALPPGPAPKEGDWFTRLRQRWPDVPVGQVPPSQPKQTDQDKPFVLVRKDGRREPFKRFSAALAVLQDGDAVEVFGNGPFTLPPIRLDGKGLTIRAGPGYRPRFAPPAGDMTRPWIMVSNAPLRLEGCDFHRPGGYIFEGSGSWAIERCRLVGDLNTAESLVVFYGPKLVVRDCLVAARSGFSCGDGVQVELTNNLSHTFEWVVGLGDGGGQTVRLNGNTILSERAAVGLGSRAGGKSITIRAEGNLFRAVQVAGTQGGAPSAGLHWEGSDNLYSLIQTFLSWDQGRAKDLDGWAKFCGRAETGSRAVPDVWFAWDQAAWDGPDKGLPALRRLTESVKERCGLAELGPRWDLVGPGDAYLRALAAAGDARAKEPLHPRPPEGGPVVLFRGGKVLRGYADLQAAFDAAADGDVIELRTDGPLAGALVGHGRDLALAVRAAPGYRPVVEGDLAFLGPARVTIEGLHFHKGAVLNRSHLGRLVRLANCSFDVRDTAEIVSMRANEGDSRPTEVVNCWLPGTVTLASDVNQKVLVRDSVIGHWSQQGGKSLRVQWDRCLLWNPGQGGHAPGGGRPTFSARAIVRQPQVRLEASARASLIESGLLHWDWDPNFSWNGTDTVYRTDNDGLLELLRKHGSAEEGSVTDAPLEWDPAQWRLLPGQPRRHAGGDYGADVDRILTAPQR